MRKLLICAALTGLLATASPAHAGHLIDMVNPPAEQLTITKGFVATGPITLLIFGGYQVSSYWQAFDIRVTPADSATNLLKPSWTFQPARSGSAADQSINRWNHVVELEFGGTSVGSYDLFWQDFSTIAGQTYDLAFLYTQDYTGPNGIKVTVDETLAEVAGEAAIPEPSTWMMMLAGFSLTGLAIRQQRKTITLFALRMTLARDFAGQLQLFTASGKATP